MASDTPPYGVHEPEHSHQLDTTYEARKSFDEQSVTKTQNEDAVMTDQAGTYKVVYCSQIANYNI